MSRDPSRSGSDSPSGASDRRANLPIPCTRSVELRFAAEQSSAQLVVAAIRARLAAVPARSNVRFADLAEAVESALRDVGGRCREAVVAEVGTGDCGAHPPWACGARQETDHDVSATWQTLLGDVRVRRAADRCPSGGVPALPRADQLGLPTDRTSPLLRARLSRFGAVAPFAEACALLEEASGVQVSAKRAQRVRDEVGARLEALE